MTKDAPDRPRLAETAPDLARLLTASDCGRELAFAEGRIARERRMMKTRDGTALATDIYLPPLERAPTAVMRTPYGRDSEKNAAICIALARRGFVAVAQDVRGTGSSEPDRWDYYMHEAEDSLDLVQWITRQRWYDGFIGGCGGSYVGQTQWCMARHTRMSAIVPEVSGLGVAAIGLNNYMMLGAYARSVGRGATKQNAHYSELERTMHREIVSGGYYNAPLSDALPDTLLRRFPELAGREARDARRALWARYCAMNASERTDFVRAALGSQVVTVLEVEALSEVFGPHVAHDAHTIPNTSARALAQSIGATPLMITGWYDWALNDALASFRLLREHGPRRVREGARLIVTPAAHNAPGYHEAAEHFADLQHNHRLEHHVDLVDRWYRAVDADTLSDWPRVIYYLMGSGTWYTATDWPPPEARQLELFLGAQGRLLAQPPDEIYAFDQYRYDPEDPTPTVGGSIISSVYPPGSVDAREVQERPDVLTYTSAVIERDIDVVGPIAMTLYASSSARDTDFCVRLSDVHPDGRAIQVQSGALRARHRDPEAGPSAIEPGRIYRFEIDMWATANRFRAGHRIRIDVSSADFPRFDRNANLAGVEGSPVGAQQSVYRGSRYPSHVSLSVL